MPDSDRDLWTAVLLQVADDIENAPYNELIYNDAVAFVQSPGPYWSASRANVALHVDMHVDDICRAGERWVSARRAREKLSPLPPPRPEVVKTRPVRVAPMVKKPRPPAQAHTKIRFVFDPNNPILAQSRPWART